MEVDAADTAMTDDADAESSDDWGESSDEESGDEDDEDIVSLPAHQPDSDSRVVN